MVYIFKVYEQRRLITAIIFFNFYFLFAACSPMDPSRSSANEPGQSSSWSPFFYYSRTVANGWTIRLRAEGDISQYVPIEPSARHLERFYQAVYDKAIANPVGGTAPGYLDLRLGALSFMVVAGSVPVPWDIIAVFAQGMLNAARRGYVGGYTVAILPPGVTTRDSPSAGAMVMSAGVNMDILTLLASGVGQEGGDGGTQWREPELVNDENAEPGSTEAQPPPCKRHCP